MPDGGHPIGASPPLRVAVVGVGAFGAHHLAAFSRVGGARVVAIVDVDILRAQRARMSLADRGEHVVVARELAEVLGPAGVDAVSIVVGGGARTGIAREAIEAGCAVLIEKPVALDARDADRIDALARAHDVVAMPAHILRHAEPYRRVVRRIRSGAVGAPRTLCFRRHRGRDHDDRFPGVHPVLLTMIHDIDLALWITGARTGEVLGVESTRAPGRNQPSRVRAEVRLDTGASCRFDVSWDLPPEQYLADAFRITGPSGELGLDLAELRARGVRGVDADSSWLTPEEGGGALDLEIADFIRSVRTRSAPVGASMRDAVDGLVIAEAIIEKERV